MIGGFFVGFFIGILVLLLLGIILFLIYENVIPRGTYVNYEYKRSKAEIIFMTTSIIVCSLVFISSGIIGAKIGAYEDRKAYESFIEKYKVQKATIENSLDNDKLSGAERVALVQSASSDNSYLAEAKVKYSKWYYWYLDYSKIKNLEYINLD